MEHALGACLRHVLSRLLGQEIFSILDQLNRYQEMSYTPKSTQVISINSAIPSFDELPDSAFIRESHLVQSPKRPGRPAPLPFSAPTLWRKVKAGTFPKPVKLSERITAFKVGEVRAWLNARSLA